MPLAVVGALAPVTVAVTGLLPAGLVADKQVPDAADPTLVTEEATPYARVPATAQTVNSRVSFGALEGVARRDVDHGGGVYFVAISEPPQSLLSWFVGHDSPAVYWMTRDERFGTQTESQQRAISLQMMRTSSQVAQYVALQRLGFDVLIVPGDVVVGQFSCFDMEGSTCVDPVPAASVLEIGDTIVAVDGTETPTVDDLAGVLAGHEPGDTVAVTVRHSESNSTEEADVALVAPPDEPERAIIGFVPFDTASLDLPFELDIDTGAIGGPSAGLAFTLTLIDDLSGGDLTGGAKVAVTGTINLDGTVGAIGGLPQKAAAVQQVGVEAFLVPASQPDIDAAREATGGTLDIIPVATVDEAMAALEDLGGEPAEPLL